MEIKFVRASHNLLHGCVLKMPPEMHKDFVLKTEFNSPVDTVHCLPRGNGRRLVTAVHNDLAISMCTVGRVLCAFTILQLLSVCDGEYMHSCTSEEDLLNLTGVTDVELFRKVNEMHYRKKVFVPPMAIRPSRDEPAGSVHLVQYGFWLPVVRLPKCIKIVRVTGYTR